MPAPRSKEPTCVDYKDRLYINEWSRTITYHDSEIDRYDTDTHEDGCRCNTIPGFRLLHPHTHSFSRPDRESWSSGSQIYGSPKLTLTCNGICLLDLH